MEHDTGDAFQEAERIGVEVSRRTALATAAKLGVGGAALAALGAGDITSASAATRDGKLSAKGYRFVLVNHVTTNPFFTPTRTGAQDACDLLGCTYQWAGSQNSIVSEMVTAVQTAIAQRVDGIGVALIDRNAFNAVARSAMGDGIPVVSYNADVPTADRLAYIGQDLFLSGQAMGQRIAQHVPSGSHIGLFIATPGSLNIQPRIDGAIAAIKASGKNITFDQIATGAATPGERSAVESYYLGHKSVKGLFAVDGGSTGGVALTSKKYGLQTHGVYTGGFDLLPETIQGISGGTMGFTIDQQPYLQGFLPILQLAIYKISGGLISPSNTNTGLKFVTKANVKPYLKSSKFEGS